MASIIITYHSERALRVAVDLDEMVATAQRAKALRSPRSVGADQARCALDLLREGPANAREDAVVGREARGYLPLYEEVEGRRIDRGGREPRGEDAAPREGGRIEEGQDLLPRRIVDAIDHDARARARAAKPEHRLNSSTCVGYCIEGRGSLAARGRRRLTGQVMFDGRIPRP